MAVRVYNMELQKFRILSLSFGAIFIFFVFGCNSNYWDDPVLFGEGQNLGAPSSSQENNKTPFDL